MSVDLRKLPFLAGLLGLPTLAVYLGAGEALRVSVKPAEYIGLIYSILAASLFATVSILGDPSNLVRGGWRTAWEQAKGVQFRLMRLTYLFLLYMLVLLLLVLSEVIEAKMLTDFYWVHSVFAWLSIAAFLLSMWLPFEIKNIQISRLEQEIRNRRTGGTGQA
ncbi:MULTISPECIES: hypothetical protein [Rhodobacterales]|jgi:hypothetical protein|uniref:hypothetical protein n=1 Tax=Rhodobacterales TaxID=204455 RepID=UPI00237F9E17|nr:hypothetical protein [Phaeobacter gallaeciensis]MDE4142540.1 hypothetical protein [Phaeobacter gallaeciensis]MDE4151004.1 hypothetical protein [Phaeobacter gallaeciensis]MDE4155233.1 hypothetical protein [Phaeobacter gallaeciensis]MDE4230604.1 hypothetical protein [Phaeobacter gallaeciensis]MDE4259681.1 hypothetical protein [Phaeobacter gallaeciensis]